MTIGLVEYTTSLGRKKTGVFSDYLKNLIDTKNNVERLPIFIQRGSFPHLDISQNLILIATGTGVAPMRHVLWERYSIVKNDPELKDVGKHLLFYGCRNKNKDFLYGEEFELFRKCENFK